MMMEISLSVISNRTESYGNDFTTLHYYLDIWTYSVRTLKTALVIELLVSLAP